MYPLHVTECVCQRALTGKNFHISNNDVLTIPMTYRLLAKRWTKDSLPALVQLGHDDILGLIGRRLGREVDDVGFVQFLIQIVQQEFL